MTDVATKPRPTRPGTSLRGFSAPLVLVLGLVIVPIALALMTLPQGAPTDEDYVRMAFASVAGCTIGIVSVVGLLVDRIVRRARASTIVLFTVIALVVVPWQLSGIGRAADQLLVNLSL
ncbi:hypothetical protein IF188_10435 [Microbacterium sp. NEAU-LLC]|uniref:MFS transporter n=1 Tax=Microbacterium helvum TaxID=2773713 RepID=A0ABR8NNA1_9MICO|nr:hypothetical protein [Microbacterium helvum]MBD3942114.1 hypothetical protein [Microbacterium helvum]